MDSVAIEHPPTPPVAPPSLEELSLKEAIALGAVDADFYNKYWFPKTFRQQTPGFHKDIDAMLDHPHNRYVAVEVFRDGAKTTKLRALTSKRIAYGISHTILFVSKTQDHAKKSIEWIKTQIEYNPRWANAFNLSKGNKWTEEEIEIWQGTDQYPIRVIAYGITGQIRGVNIDDFRPDLIVVDDPCDEQNTNTFEQREKIKSLFFGTIYNTLAPDTDIPTAKMVLLQTPLDPDDLVENCMRDPNWVSAKFSCFDESGESRWPARWTTETLEKEKAAAIARNQLSLWLREKECRLISPETCMMKPEWLNFYEILPPRNELIVASGIDPAPPMSEKKLQSGDHSKDYHAQIVWAQHIRSPNRYLLDYRIEKNADPEWVLTTFFQLLYKWRFTNCGVETVAYQQMLATLLQKAMLARRQYCVIKEFNDRRSKPDRIRQDISTVASNGILHVKREHTEFIDEFNRYPQGDHDHLLDGTAVCFDALVDASVVMDALEEEEDNMPDQDLSTFLSCP